MKNCTNCKEEKLESEFYKKCDTKDGLMSQCKSCRAEYDREHYLLYKEEKAEYNRGYNQTHKAEKAEYNRGYTQTHKAEIAEYNRTPARKEGRKGADKRRREKYPEKIKARKAVFSAIRSGKLQRPSTCEQCKEERDVHGHHEDYSKSLEVQWLCNPCHTEVHRLLRERRCVLHSMVK